LPSINAMKIMAGAAIGGTAAGLYGWKSSADDQDLDAEDRLALTTSSVVAGVAGGAALAKIGPARIGAGIKGLATGALGISKGMGKINAAATKFGAGKAPWLKGPMKLLALTAAIVGVMAYGARSNPQTAAYASRDEAGEMEYGDGPVKARMNKMGAVGDMVFGMHNTRHG
jgi:hypothetical protein